YSEPPALSRVHWNKLLYRELSNLTSPTELAVSGRRGSRRASGRDACSTELGSARALSETQSTQKVLFTICLKEFNLRCGRVRYEARSRSVLQRLKGFRKEHTDGRQQG